MKKGEGQEQSVPRPFFIRTPTMTSPVSTLDYTQAIKHAGFYLYPDAGILQISGEDQESFLQRQTTNDIRLLRPGTTQISVLTSPVGRILDVLYVMKEQPNTGQIDAIQSLTILPLPGNTETTHQFLKSRIFFMDKVSLTNHSQKFAQFDLFGPQASDILEEVLDIPAPEINQVIQAGSTGELLRVLGLFPVISIGYRLIVSKNNEKSIQNALEALQTARINQETYQLLRIEAGIPGPGAELSEAYTPLETGLISAVSQSKGCYTGQEVIARQVNYDKVTQSMCGISLETSAAVGSVILADDVPVGKLTSIANSPRFGNIGLAIVKRPYNLPGRKLTIEEDPIEVRGLPFTQ